MGSDTSEVFAEPVKFGNNFSVSLNIESNQEADEIFNKLVEGGKVIMPMDKTFWSPYFGMLTDKYGINWMVNVDQGENV